MTTDERIENPKSTAFYDEIGEMFDCQIAISQCLKKHGLVLLPDEPDDAEVEKAMRVYAHSMCQTGANGKECLRAALQAARRE